MSNKGNVLISFVILVLGGVFIWLYDRDILPRFIVLLCGLAFVVPAVLSLLSTFFTGKNSRRGSAMRIIQMVCGVGGLGLGLCIMLMPDVFRPLLFYPFGALMIVGGLFQVFQLSNRNRPTNYPGWLYVAPILVLAAGIVTLCLPALHGESAERWLVLVSGIAALLFGINGIIISVENFRHAREVARKAKESAATETEKKDEKESEKAPEKPEKSPEKDADTSEKPAVSTAEPRAESSETDTKKG